MTKFISVLGFIKAKKLPFLGNKTWILKEAVLKMSAQTFSGQNFVTETK